MQLHVCLYSLKFRKVSQYYYLPLLSRDSQRGTFLCDGWGVGGGFVSGRSECEGRWVLAVSRTHGAVVLKVFEKFCSTLPEVSQICAAELTWFYMLLIVKTLVTPTGFKEA